MPRRDTPEPPSTFLSFVEKYPDLSLAHESIGKAAVRSHVSRASHLGATHQEIEQAILLAMNTVGFPRTVAAWQWAQQQFDRDSTER